MIGNENSTQEGAGADDVTGADPSTTLDGIGAGADDAIGADPSTQRYDMGAGADDDIGADQ